MSLVTVVPKAVRIGLGPPILEYYAEPPEALATPATAWQMSQVSGVSPQPHNTVGDMAHTIADHVANVPAIPYQDGCAGMPSMLVSVAAP